MSKIALINLLIFASFQFSCSKEDKSSPKTSTSGASLETDHSRFSQSCIDFEENVELPAELCGLQGYTYLHKSFIQRACGSCHYSGSPIHVNALADKDVNIAFESAKLFPPQKLLETILGSQFVSSDCHIPSGHPFENDVETWINNRQCN